jgi:signal peptidase I
VSGTAWLGTTAATALAVVAAAVGAAAWVRRNLVVITVVGTSMRPAIEPGDRVLVRRAGIARLRRGQLVVAVPGRPPRVITHRDPLLMIKRVLAVPGDPVPRAQVPALRTVSETVVPPGRLVLLGDNPAGTDSRQLGYFHGESLIGVVVRGLSKADRQDGG